MLDHVAEHLRTTSALANLRNRAENVAATLKTRRGELTEAERNTLRALGASLGSICGPALAGDRPSVSGAGSRADISVALRSASVSLRAVEVSAGFRERGRKPSSVDRDLSPDLHTIRELGLALLTAFPLPPLPVVSTTDAAGPQQAEKAASPAPDTPDVEASADVEFARAIGLVGIRPGVRREPPSADVRLAQQLGIAGIRPAEKREAASADVLLAQELGVAGIRPAEPSE